MLYPAVRAKAILELKRRGIDLAQRPLWTPNPDHADGTPNPQRLAAESKADILGFGGSAGGGKALSLDTPLPTPSGWITMRQAKIGDSLFDDGGNVCRIIATSEIMTGHNCYEVEFSDGTKIIADEGHKWVTKTAKERLQCHHLTEEFRATRREKRESRYTGVRPDLLIANKERVYQYLLPPNGEIRTTKDIFDTLTVGNGRINHSITACSPVVLPELEYEIDPYILGAWLGDGSSYKGEITNADQEVLDEFGKIYKCVHRVDYTYGIYGLVRPLRIAGLLGNKHIPQEYLRGSIFQRLALLQGLMDTDGYCDSRGQCEFTTTKIELAEGVVELLGTLGIKATIKEGIATLYGKDCGAKYRIKFLTELQVFRIKRKSDRQKIDNFRGTHNVRYITSVKQVPSVPVKCIAVSSESHLYLASRAFIPTHNTDLLLGVAATQHKNSVIFRRVFPSLRGIVERSRAIFNPDGRGHPDDSFNESMHRWKLTDGKQIEFEACQYEKDREKQRGRPRDFYGFDEATEFTRSQIEFITGWNRSTDPAQRCRIILTFNPPTDEGGSWVIDYFLPWIAYLFPNDFTHPNPAKPGELRWYATIDGKETECDNDKPFEHKGRMVRPLSRTFIPSKLSDNPHLANTNYEAVLQSLPEPLRSQVLEGNFAAAKERDPWQCIPAEHVRAAQKRWLEREQPKTPITGVGCDIARGGGDKTTVCVRYDNWFSDVVSYPGAMTTDGPITANLISRCITGDPGYVNVDIIGVGGSAYDSLKVMYKRVNPINAGAESKYRDRSGTLKMRNIRAEYYWRLREALDPVNGDDIALPPGNEVLADLCVARYKPTVAGIQIESKDEIKLRIGRSPDVGEAILLANYPGQPRGVFVG